MTKNNLLLTIIICTTLLTSTIFAGIHQVVILLSPDDKQHVRVYYDNHALGTIAQNEQQFDIIDKSIQKFSATGKHMDILVEAPDFYLPLEQDWVYVLRQEEQPQDIQAITAQTLQTEFARKAIQKLQKPEEKDRSSLFFPIPYLIGQHINPENPEYKNIRLISIDPRLNCDYLYRFIANETISPFLQNRSLNDLFTQLLAQIRTTHKTIDYELTSTTEQEAAATMIQAAIRGTLARSLTAVQKKIVKKLTSNTHYWKNNSPILYMILKPHSVLMPGIVHLSPIYLLKQCLIMKNKL